MVKRIFQIGLITLIGLLVVAIPVYAASVANALYVADLVIKNTGTATTNVSTVCPINTQALIDGKYVTSDLLNTAIQTPGGTDVPYMPGIDTDPWVIFVPAIAASEQKSYLFYTGGPAMQDNLMYFPNTGGMTSDDSASLELGDNFEVEQMGYIDTSAGSNKSLVYKECAFRIWVSGEGEISAWFMDQPTDETLRPNAAGDETNISSQFPDSGAHWDKVDEETPDEASTRVYTAVGSWQRDLYNLTASSGSGTINFIEIYFRCSQDGTGTFYAKPSLKSDSTVTDGTEIQVTSEWVTYSEQWSTNPADGEAWEWADIDALQIGVSLKGDTGNYIRCTQVYVVVAAGESKTVTATGVSSGEHAVKVTADGINFKIYVGGVEKDSVALAGASVQDNSNNWSFLTNGSMLYMDYHKITVGGTLKQHIVYERDTTFSDLSGNNNDATPTFITESTDPDVSATLSNFRPIEEAELTGYSIEESPEMLTTPPEQPPELYGLEGWGFEHLPGAELINMMLEKGGIPPDFFWIWFCYGMAALGVIGGYHFIRSSLLFPTLIGFVIILFFSLTSGGDPIPLWTIIPYSVISAGLLVSERVFGW